jgi:uncharacterized membrane protein YebE (DUF533 family)
MKNPAMPAAIVMFLVSAVILGLGVYAFVSAPEGANKMTAIIIPAAIAVVLDLCAAGAILLGNKSPTSAKNAVVIGALVCMLTAGVVAMQGWKRSKGQERFVAAQSEWTRMTTPDPRTGVAARPDNPESRKAFFETQDAPEHDVSYLVNAMYAIAGAGGVGFLLLLALKPKQK